jgi:hypothetical protein
LNQLHEKYNENEELSRQVPGLEINQTVNPEDIQVDQESKYIGELENELFEQELPFDQ